MEGEPGTAFSFDQIKATVEANPGAKVLFLTHGAKAAQCEENVPFSMIAITFSSGAAR